MRTVGGPVCGLRLPGNEATTALDIGTHHFGRASRSLVVDQLDSTKVKVGSKFVPEFHLWSPPNAGIPVTDALYSVVLDLHRQSLACSSEGLDRSYRR